MVCRKKIDGVEEKHPQTKVLGRFDGPKRSGPGPMVN